MKQSNLATDLVRTGEGAGDKDCCHVWKTPVCVHSVCICVCSHSSILKYATVTASASEGSLEEGVSLCSRGAGLHGGQEWEAMGVRVAAQQHGMLVVWVRPAPVAVSSRGTSGGQGGGSGGRWWLLLGGLRGGRDRTHGMDHAPSSSS